MSHASTSLNIVVIHPGQAHDAEDVIKAIERLDDRGSIGLGEIGIVERTAMGWIAPVSEGGQTLESLADAMETPEGVEAEEAAAALTFIGQQIPPDSQAVVAILAEPEGVAIVDREIGQLGGTVHRRPAIEVFIELEEALDRQERRRTFRSRAAKKLDRLVTKKIEERTSLLDRIDRTLSRPFDRLADRRLDDPET